MQMQAAGNATRGIFPSLFVFLAALPRMLELQNHTWCLRVSFAHHGNYNHDLTHLSSSVGTTQTVSVAQLEPQTSVVEQNLATVCEGERAITQVCSWLIVVVIAFIGLTGLSYAPVEERLADCLCICC